MGQGRRLGASSGRMLEDAGGAGVMDELPAGDQPFPHGDLAPGAEAVWEVGRRLGRGRIRWGARGHGRILSDRREPCQPTGDL